ncbi:MAG: S-layer homology domain-containing protein [Clostridiales bacterium]|nr:S-layer homology domain-containing protein [Clostridiales bacterium]
MDVGPADWFCGDVEYTFESGLFMGTSGNAFSPDAPMTRGMVAAVLGRLAGAARKATRPAASATSQPGNTTPPTPGGQTRAAYCSALAQAYSARAAT